MTIHVQPAAYRARHSAARAAVETAQLNRHYIRAEVNSIRTAAGLPLLPPPYSHSDPIRPIPSAWPPGPQATRKPGLLARLWPMTLVALGTAALTEGIAIMVVPWILSLGMH
jgi:hypothetical protein